MENTQRTDNQISKKDDLLKDKVTKLRSRSVHWKTNNIADGKESRSFHQESDFLQQALQGD